LPHLFNRSIAIYETILINLRWEFNLCLINFFLSGTFFQRGLIVFENGTLIKSNRARDSTVALPRWHRSSGTSWGGTKGGSISFSRRISRARTASYSRLCNGAANGWRRRRRRRRRRRCGVGTCCTTALSSLLAPPVR